MDLLGAGDDVVVIGGGHNGLTAATMLAVAGRTVVVLERRDLMGGIAAGEAFGDGQFRTRGLLDATCRVRPAIVTALGLEKHGLTRRHRPPLFGAQKEGPGLLVGAEVGAAELGEDVLGFRNLRAFIQRITPVVRRLMDEAPPDIGDDAKLMPLVRPALGLRKLGRKDLMELLRVAPACVDDWVSEEVSNPLLRAMLCSEALPGTWMGPRSPTSTTMLLVAEALAGREVQGGPAALVDALVSAANAAGVELRTGVEVTRIVVENGAVTGVETSDGVVEASVVVSCVGPKTTLLDLVAPMDLSPAIERDLSDVRHRGTMAKIHLGLSQPLRFRDDDAIHERLLVGAEDPLDLERAFDHAKHRRLPLDPPPPLHIRQWPCDDGGYVASITLHCAAHDLDGGWTPEARDSLYAAAMTTLDAYVPGVADTILASETLSPADLETRYSLAGGHPFHGEHALDQMGPLRPIPRLARYATTLGGLYLGSSGMHPGFGVTCGPGALAARAVLGPK
jgi:phytoene dehydrogenase-like protein